MTTTFIDKQFRPVGKNKAALSKTVADGRVVFAVVGNTKAATFADTRGQGRPGRKPPEIQAVDDYQRELEGLYTTWAEDTARDVARADSEDRRDEIIAAAIIALLLLLQTAGRRSLPDAAMSAAGDAGLTPELLELVRQAVAENDAYLSTSLTPEAERRLREVVNGADWANAVSQAARVALLAAALQALTSRVATYAGAWWALYQQTTAISAPDTQRIFWKLDERAAHCDTCLTFGNREYESYQALLTATGGITPASGTICRTNCRCSLVPVPAT